jgi:hypothetical protein
LTFQELGSCEQLFFDVLSAAGVRDAASFLGFAGTTVSGVPALANITALADVPAIADILAIAGVPNSNDVSTAPDCSRPS